MKEPDNNDYLAQQSEECCFSKADIIKASSTRGRRTWPLYGSELGRSVWAIDGSSSIWGRRTWHWYGSGPERAGWAIDRPFSIRNGRLRPRLRFMLGLRLGGFRVANGPRQEACTTVRLDDSDFEDGLKDRRRNGAVVYG